MRLSTHTDRTVANGVAVIHAALDAGVRLLDTADVYCLDDSDRGHNERLVAQALRSWKGDASVVEVATKGGMRRPDGAWVPDGRASHLKAACAASIEALGVDVIDLYQLHVVDPRVPFQTSVRALAALQRDGLIQRVGLCNVNVSQIEIARDMVTIESVQVALSVFEREPLRNGVAEYCAEHGIRLIAYRPLGGAKRVRSLANDELLARIAAAHDTTAQDIALAWLRSLGSNVVPIPGPTRAEHAAALAQVARIELTSDELSRLDERFGSTVLRVPRARRRPPDDADGDVVLIMGMPGAGKSTVAQQLTSAGYMRLNRDVDGGKLADLVPVLEAGLAAGRRHFVLDNTYASRADRHDIIECAWRHGVPVRVIWIDTDIADAQINAITRLIEAHGSLPSPEALRERGKSDPRYFGPDAQFRYQRELEPPREREGFKSIERRPFGRQVQNAGKRRAVFFDPSEATDSARHVLRTFHQEGWLLIAVGWRPPGRTVPLVSDLEYEYVECTHPAGAPICWCRKPLPGLLLECGARYGLDVQSSIIAGNSSADRTMAARLGMRQIPLG